jgi:RNA-directed DNA polymerase
MPHKLGNLWPQIADYDALLFAWQEVKQRKSSKVNILRYQSNLASNLSRVERKLLDGTYRPRPHFEFWINDPKPRLIQAPHLEDRIVQHAVCNALREPLTRRLIFHTYTAASNCKSICATRAGSTTSAWMCASSSTASTTRSCT